MAITANGTPTDTYSLLVSSTGTGTLSVSNDTFDIQVVNHDSGSTPPAETLKGHTVRIGTILPVGLKNGDHIWHRIAPLKDLGTEDDEPKTVYTVQT